MNAAIEQLLAMSPEDQKAEIKRRKAAHKKAIAKVQADQIRLRLESSANKEIVMREAGTLAVRYKDDGKSLVQQSNAIGLSPREQVERMTKGLNPTNIAAKKPVYGDFTNATDYQTSLNIVRKANESFQSLPAKVREQFGNNPLKFVEFASKKENLSELNDMGIFSIVTGKLWHL